MYLQTVTNTIGAICINTANGTRFYASNNNSLCIYGEGAARNALL
jgi:hypothetical protein